MSEEADNRYGIIPGQLVRSKAGHDKGTLYMVVRADDSGVYVCDGYLKPLAHQKRKNVRHVQKILEYICSPEDLEYKNMRDDDIKRAIRQYEKRCGNRETTL